MRPLLLLVAVMVTVDDARAASPSDALQVLLQNCGICHGQAQLSGLDLRTRDGLLRGGSRGPAIQPGDAESSLLYRAVVRDGDLSMPPESDPLSAEAVALLRQWIDDGAQWPQGGPAAEGGGWWSFEPVVRPPLPDDPTGWSLSPIDRFIAAKQRDRGLEPVGEASRRAWIRRATYDLHGLPPEPADVEAFLRDDSKGAHEAVIDRLLTSDRYGERWGRLWLDVVRYADSGGFETDIYFPDAWRYRDYVIQSFNDDKPFDRFVQEQLAADEIWPDDIELRGSYEIPQEKQRNLEARIGTGMYTIGTVYHEAALNGHQLRYEWLVDAVDVTGEAFLGLTLGCARCHDHKFDPIGQREYHQLMAYFAGSQIRRVPAVHKMSEFGYYSAYPRQLKVFDLQRAIKALDSAVRKRLEESIVERFDAEVVRAFRVPRSQRTAEQQSLAVPLERALTEAGLRENPAGYEPQLPYTPDELDRRRTLVVQLGEAAAKASFELPTATVLGKAEVAYPVRMTQRGDWKAAGDTVLPRLPRALAAGGHEAQGAGRRDLAKWLTDPRHPLLARVMVNRIWQGHFGWGIVGTPNNFGRQGDPPSHPKLLDWLAAEFVDSGWSIKEMHRLIMLSSTYRLASSADSRNMQADPENRLLWRMNRRRLDAEGLRDSVLWAAGTLNLKMGGRPVLPPLSEEERLGMWNRDAWPESLNPAEHNRRSVYVFAKRQFPYPMFKSFDMPDPAVSCGRRAKTTVAPQALTLLNSEFMLSSAEAFAERLSDAGGPREQVDRAWMVAFSRPQTEREREQAAEMLSLAGPREFALMLLNMNEFAYVD